MCELVSLSVFVLWNLFKYFENNFLHNLSLQHLRPTPLHWLSVCKKSSELNFRFSLSLSLSSLWTLLHSYYETYLFIFLFFFFAFVGFMWTLFFYYFFLTLVLLLVIVVVLNLNQLCKYFLTYLPVKLLFSLKRRVRNSLSYY